MARPAKNGLGRDLRARLRRELEIAAREEATGTRSLHVHCDEIGARNTVAVGEDQVMGVRGQHRLIEDAALTKTCVRLPDMSYSNSIAVRDRTDDDTGRLARAVIRDDELEIGALLGRISYERRFQAVGCVVGTQNDGRAHRISPAGVTRAILRAECENIADVR